MYLLPVSFWCCVLEIFFYIVCRHRQTGNIHVKVKGFAMSTGTSVKRQHLVDCHINTWISNCDRLKIPITAKAAQDAVRDYRTRQGQAYSQPLSTNPIARAPFSQDAFVDAIMNFIIADDQVWFRIYFPLILLIISYRVSTLLRVLD
jgi:hypothetical protein